jgi:hypothetical protein
LIVQHEHGGRFPLDRESRNEISIHPADGSCSGLTIGFRPNRDDPRNHIAGSVAVTRQRHERCPPDLASPRQMASQAERVLIVLPPKTTDA